MGVDGGVHLQDKSYTGLKPKARVSLRSLLTTQQTETIVATAPTPEPITRYAKNRFRHSKGYEAGTLPQTLLDNTIIQQDPATNLYLRDLEQRRGNNGILGPTAARTTANAVKNFLNYTDIEITNHAIQDLVTYKRNNRNSTNIELALKSFALEPPVKHHSNLASRIQGIFRANFATLEVRINTHFTPPEENCTKGIFLEIYKHLTPEQQEMIQWGLHVPERAKAAYRVPLTDIDLSRNDFAIVKIAGAIPNANNIRSKMRVDHPCLPPIALAKRIVASANAAGRNCPFPNHEWQWSQISHFAQREYHVRLKSNYTRKLFESAAKHSTLMPSLAAFIMGDKTKLAETGHLPLIYDPELRPMEREQFIADYAKSGIAHLIDEFTEINTSLRT